MRRFDPTRPLAPGITLLEASAGTGKTYGITSVVLRLVAQEGFRIDEILVVTFTDAATAELLDRVRGRLRDAAIALEVLERGGVRPEDEVVAAIADHARANGGIVVPQRRLREALQRFDDAAISTIHGFCARVLREHAFECAAEFDAELLEDTEELLDEVVRDFWAREVATRPVELVEGLLQQKLSLKRLISLAGKVVAAPDMELVPPEPQTVVSEKAPPAAWEAALPPYHLALQKCSAGWIDSGPEIRALLLDARERGELNENSWRVGAVERRAADLDQWANDPDSDLPKDFRCFGTEYVRKATKKKFDPLTHPVLADVQELVDRHSAYTAAVTEELLILEHACAAYVREEFARRKRARGLQTYDDLLRQVHGALADKRHGEPLARDLRRRYRAALIDEFQDTDAVQWEIFRRIFLAEDRHLVLIGDPKQAIYSFRGADVHTYLAAREESADRFDLEANWRSDTELVRAVNHLFGRHPRPFGHAEIGYTRVESRHGQRLHGAGPAPLEVRFIPRTGSLASGVDGKGVPKPVDKQQADPVIPAIVAEDIATFLRSGARLVERIDGRETERAVGPRDLAVLVRKGKQARAVQQALRRLQVPSVLHGAESVFCTREAEELRCVLGALLEPSNHWLARAALSTDLLGIPAAAELMDADADGNGTATCGVGDALARLVDDESAWDAWLLRLHEWGAAWGKRGFMRAFRTMLEELELPRRMLALEDGERRMTNFLHLAELLHTASVQDRLQPAALLHWLGRQQALDERRVESRQLRLESDADAVQIVTMHASKGLEYPVVWCPYLWDGALTQKRDKVHARFYEEVAGRKVRRLDIGAGDTPERKEHLARMDDECFTENLRLAYVALTRARHRCTVYWGGIKDNACSPLGWLLHGLDVDAAAPVRDVRELLAKRVKALDDDTLHASLEELAVSSGGTIVATIVQRTPVGPWSAPGATDRPLAARCWTRATPLDRDWRVGSFTGLVHGSRGVHAAPAASPAMDDEAPEALNDAQPLETVVGAEASGGDSANLEGFPSSAKAGILFHEIFEKHDFTRPLELHALVQDRLGAYAFDAARWTEPVTATLQQALETPLSQGATPLVLADIPAARRLNELRVEFPVSGGFDAATGALTPSSLASAFHDHPGGRLPASYADRVAQLGFRPLRGFMTGVIDLVVEHDGRWWVLDYKSNRLGARLDDYAPDRIDLVMAEADYFLQYHLYVLALHRYLAWRVPGYSYDTHIGGVRYLFVRGMRREDGASRGVFTDRPPAGRITALDRLLAAREVLA